MKIGVSTGGGDCPGLNAVIRAIYKTATSVYDAQVYGIEDGLEGLIDLDYRSPDGNRYIRGPEVRGILRTGGTILGTSNKSNPFAYPVVEDGERVERDLSGRVMANYEKLGLDGVVMIGGDGTMGIAHRLAGIGMNVVGVPKTIDNDLGCTDYTFGFDTAVNIATEALDRLHTTAASHDRVLLLELMGRDAGFIALHAGIAGSADVIVLPEMEYDVAAVAQKIERRRQMGKPFSIVVVAEGAKASGGDKSTLGPKEAGKALRLGGAAERLAASLAEAIDLEIRVVVLGHLQRGGSPTAFDRLLGTRYGVEAAHLACQGKWGRMVSLRGLEISDVAIEDAVGKVKRVQPDGQMVRAARSAGISFGTPDEL